jgi:hypothetical protein|tara:strand:+ start:533 stop:925 length:393 start_codon:yes stop_codon:yes gene_type:complete
MNSLIKKSIVFLSTLLLSLNLFASTDGQGSFIWNGVVRSSELSHTTDHTHFLEFVRSEDKEVFDIVDSPELAKLHHDTNRNYRVEIEGQLTSKFLFWGGNLVVKKFKVLEELDVVALREPRRISGSSELR